MRQRGWVVLTGLVLAAAIGVGAQEVDLNKAPRVTMPEFRSALAAGKVLVIDVRDEQSYALGHVPGARSLPLSVLLEPQTVARLKKETRPIVLYCA